MTGIVKILVAIVGVAIVAVLVARGSKTADTLTGIGNALSQIIKAAVAPVR